MIFRYSEWDDERHGQAQTTFEKLLDLFQQLLQFTAGDATEALNWLTQLDKRYGITDEEMGIGDFIEELKRQGYLKEDTPGGVLQITARTERTLRQRSMEEIFTQLRKSGRGNHKTPFAGAGDERLPETRGWKFGDDPNLLDVTGTLSNAFRRGGTEEWNLAEDDFEVYETDHRTTMATVMMIDLSHSMVLYGEDRITPARKTAMALAELITTRYPKDTLDIVAFGNDAWEVQIKDLPYLNVGPYYTNTRAGLQRARDILRRRKNQNKQIFMITDGKPSCHIEYGRMYRERLRPRPEDRQQGAGRGRHLPPRARLDHDVHDRPRLLPPELRPRAHRGQPGPRLLRLARQPRRVHLRGLRPQPPQAHAVGRGRGSRER